MILKNLIKNLKMRKEVNKNPKWTKKEHRKHLKSIGYKEISYAGKEGKFYYNT